MSSLYSYSSSSLIRCGFDDGRWTADHFVQVGAGRYHREHRIFLFDLEVNHRRMPRSPRRLDDAGDVAPLFDRDAGDPERLGQLREIRPQQWRRGIPLVVEELLPLLGPDFAKLAQAFGI